VSDVRGFATALVLIVVGVAVAAAAGGRVALEAAGLAIAGIGGVVGVATAFWIIGRSEDREREGRP
jgi:hypothetical protein